MPHWMTLTREIRLGRRINTFSNFARKRWLIYARSSSAWSSQTLSARTRARVSRCPPRLCAEGNSDEKVTIRAFRDASVNSTWANPKYEFGNLQKLGEIILG
jgi:hypothetical protein